MSSILIIDDDHDIRVSLRQTLETEGYVIHSAASGSEAMKVLKKIKTPCLILLDLMLPLMTGEDFLKMKNSDQTLASIPVLVITANLHLNTNLPGIIGCLPKPLDFEELLEFVNQHC